MQMALNAVIVVLTIIAGVWAAVGSIAGVILSLVYFFSENKSQKTALKPWIKASFGGVVALLLIFVLYFVVKLIFVFFGI